jgi:hypothetical protein
LKGVAAKISVSETKIMELRNHLLQENFKHLQMQFAQAKDYAKMLRLRVVDVNPYIMDLVNTCSVGEILHDILGQTSLNCPYVFQKGSRRGQKCLAHCDYKIRLGIKCEDVNAAIHLLNPYCPKHRHHWDAEAEKPKLFNMIKQKQGEKRAQMCETMRHEEHLVQKHLAALKAIMENSLKDLRLLRVMDLHSVINVYQAEKLELQLQNLVNDKEWENILNILSATTHRIIEKFQ